MFWIFILLISLNLVEGYNIYPARSILMMSRGNKSRKMPRERDSATSYGGPGVGKFMGRERSGRDNSIRQARVARALNMELAEIIADGDIKAFAYPEEDLLRYAS